MDGDHQTRFGGPARHPDGPPDANAALLGVPAGAANAWPDPVAPARTRAEAPVATVKRTAARPADGGPGHPPAPPRDPAAGPPPPAPPKDTPKDMATGPLPPALSIVAAGDMLSPAREITASTAAAKILFTRDDFDTTYVSGRRGMMVLSLVEDGTSYRVGRYDVESGEWRILSKGWPRFGNALAFACTIVS